MANDNAFDLYGEQATVKHLLTCSSRCTEAKGAQCACKCCGKNHGIGWDPDAHARQAFKNHAELAKAMEAKGQMSLSFI